MRFGFKPRDEHRRFLPSADTTFARRRRGELSVRVAAAGAATLLLAPGMAVAQTPVSRESRLERYESATIDANGDLAIVMANGLTITVRKEGEQTSFSAPVLASSKELPIFEWAFADGGTRVAHGQEPVHFGCATHYELRDIDSERLIEAVDIPQPCGQIPNPGPVTIPPWVADLMSKKQAG